MTYNSLLIHKIVSVELEPISQLTTGAYTRALVAIDENGNEMQLVLFSDDESSLEIKDKQ